LTGFHESIRVDPWKVEQADSKYLEGQLKAIVAVKMRVRKVEAKDKLSRNRPHSLFTKL
jgi:transcriptional regulator